MPGFPDKFSPFYQAPPGGEISSTVSRITGTGIRFLRAFSQRDRNRETHWDETGIIPSGWMTDSPRVSPADKFVHYFYEKLQFHKAVKPGSRKERR